MFILNSEDSLAPTVAIAEQERNTVVATGEAADLQFVSKGG